MELNILLDQLIPARRIFPPRLKKTVVFCLDLSTLMRTAPVLWLSEQKICALAGEAK